MPAFDAIKRVAIPIDIRNCDTDQIIPARFLKVEPESDDYARCLFHDLRFAPNGDPVRDFIFNDARYRGAGIVVADHNWGCGSSREQAVWVLAANNIQCVIAPSFADIHYSNCVKQGILPVVLPESDCERLREHLHEAAGEEIAVDLQQQTITAINGSVFNFTIDAFDKECLLQGLDDIGLTQQFETSIDDFERQRVDYDWL